MGQPLLTALIGIVSALVGASVQFLFSRRSENTKHFRELRTRAYTDFLTGVATLAIAQKQENTVKELDATILVTDAKGRIAVYGSASVANALADFFAQYGTLNSPAALAAFTAVVALMRAETPGGEGAIKTQAVQHLLFR